MCQGFLWPKMWSMSHVSWRICILFLLDGLLYRCQFHRADWWCCWVQLCPYWFSACWIWSLLQSGVLRSPMKLWILLFLLEVLSASASCCNILLLGTPMLRIIISFWIIDLFFIMQCFPLTFITFFSLKSAFFEINIVTPSFSSVLARYYSQFIYL